VGSDGRCKLDYSQETLDEGQLTPEQASQLSGVFVFVEALEYKYKGIRQCVEQCFGTRLVLFPSSLS
jgi:hypothetical protein